VARGQVVLASDASHYYEHGNRPSVPDRPNVADMLDGIAGSSEADSADHVIPGHDPQVLERYPLVAGDEHGIACLHLPPLAAAGR
jgi:hypothetical protein